MAERADRTQVAELIRPVRGRTTVAACCQGLAAALVIAPGVLLVEMGRRLLAGERTGLWPLLWLAVGLVAARLVLYAVAELVSHLADTRLAGDLRARLADQLGRLPLHWFAGGVSGRVSTVVQDDVGALHHAVAHARGDLAAAIAGPAVIACYLLWVSWPLALVTFATTASAQTMRMRLAKLSADPVERIAAANTELRAASMELVAGIDVLKAFGGTAGPARFQVAARAHAQATDEVSRIIAGRRAVTRATVAPAALLLIITGCGIGATALGIAEPVDVLAFVLLGLSLFELLTPVYTARNQRRTTASAGGRVAALLHEPPAPVAAHPVALPAGALTVQLDAVRFGYREGHEVLHGVDATLAPGTVTAVVGPSGAGKSTLGLLLARFYDVTGGAIRIGGVDIRDLDRTELYRHVGFLFQDVVLLRQSVRDNITLADPDAGEQTLRRVAKAAAIHDRITALPDGYDTVLGAGVRLSGGEAQRVSIARTLIADTPILVLDEATASADPESESAVQDGLAELAAGRTVLVIAHRLHTITAVDQILLLDNGIVAERGTHAELLAAGGRYAALWAAQRGAS